MSPLGERGCATCGGGGPIRPEGCAWWCAQLVDDGDYRRLPEHVGKRYPAVQPWWRDTP